MKLMKQIFSIGLLLLWASNGRGQAIDANGGSPGVWDQQIQARDLTGKRGQEQVDLFTGSFNYSIPINCPPARNGSEPRLALDYSSGSQNSWCGMGWNLEIGHIERNTKDGFPIRFTTDPIPFPGTNYDDSKGFLLNLSGKESKLYAVATTGTTVEYRAETDTEFLRCFLDTTNNNWTVYDKSGNAYIFGQSTNSRVSNPKTHWGGYSSTFHWALDEVDTVTGDQTTVGYASYKDPEGLAERTIYPTNLTYNGHLSLNGYTASANGNCTISFGTELRPDRRNSYRWGFRTEQNRRLTNIVCQVGTQKVWRYALKYTPSTATGRSLLSSVTAYGSDDSTALPVQTFTYQQNPNGVSFGNTMQWANFNLNKPGSTSGGLIPYITSQTDSDLFDIDGDGLPDRVCLDGSGQLDVYQVQRNLGLQSGSGSFGTRYSFGPAASGVNEAASDANPLPSGGNFSGLNNSYVRLHDINGDGLPDRVVDWWKHFQYYTTYPYTNFEVMLNTGSGFAGVAQWPLATNDMGADGSSIMSVIESPASQAYVGFFDINGDGLPDRIMSEYNKSTSYYKVQYNTGTNFLPVTYFGPSRSQNYTNAAYGNSWAGIPQSDSSMMIDMNGDGLPDHVMMPMTSGGGRLSAINDTYFAVEFNNGYSFESTNTSISVPGAADIWSGVNPQVVAGYDFAEIQNLPCVGMYDLNGDGLPDRVMINSTNMFTANPTWLVYLNNGRGFNSTPIVVSNIDNQGEYSGSYLPNWCSMQGTINNSVVTTLIDINGDGLLDRVMNVYNGDYENQDASTNANYLLVQLNDGPFPDLLTNINNGMGGNYAITYQPSTAYNNQVDPNDASQGSELPFIYQNVASVTESDGVNGSRTTGYNYSGGYYDGPRREFRGFAAVTVTNPPSPISATYNRVTVHYFHQGGGQDHAAIGKYQDSGAFAKQGMAYRVESYGNNGSLYHVTVNQINQANLGNGRYFPYVQASFECDYPGPKITATKFAYDYSTGNLTNRIDYGLVTGFSPSSFTITDSDATDTQYHTTHYASLGNGYILDHPDDITLKDSSGNVVQETKYSYNSDSGTLAAKLTRIAPSCYATNSYSSYSTYGLAGLATDPVGVQTEIGYDSTYTFQTTTRLRTTPGSDTSNDLTTTNSYDARSGLVTGSTPPTGVTVTNIYDALFRLTESDRISITGSKVWMKKLGYNLGVISSGTAVSYVDETNNDGVGGMQTRTYVDGFDRPIQERIQGENSNFRVVSTAYDERGQRFLTTWPSFGTTATFAKPGSQTASWTGYDAAGRVATNRLVAASFDSTTGAFSGKSDLAGDTGSALGARTWSYANGTDPWWIVFTDEDGKVRRYQLDAFGRTNQIQEADGTNNYVTTLKHDLAGNLTNIVNANSENIYFGYNDAGELMAMADPYLGQWKYQRDFAGRVRLQTDGRGNVISNSYINPTTGCQDPMGRLRQQTVFACTNYISHLLAPAFTNTYTYDAGDSTNFPVYKGLLYKVTDGEGAETNGYDVLGRLVKTTRHVNINSQNYTTVSTYNDGDKLASTAYPNSGPTITNQYFTGGSLKQVSRSGGVEVYYSVSAGSYDVFGHVTNFVYGNGLSTKYAYYSKSQRLQSISCGSSVFNRSYTYSAADDITSILGTGISGTIYVTNDNLHRIKSYTGLTGSYQYDPVGNLGNNIETGTVQTYSYGARRTQAVKGAFGLVYLYDLCGNMIVRRAGLTNSQSLAYDAENRLVRVAQAGTNYLLVKFGYAGDGARLWKWDNQMTTNLQVWIGNIYEEKGGKVLYHVFAGSQQVCTFEANSTLYGGSDTNRVAYYYHEDNLNSSTALSSGAATGTQIEVNVYYPFGRVQTASPQAAFKVSRQFTGQIKDDETGLYYYNARYYDAELGRFIQADTEIPDLSNPQSYNRYSYCVNDPLRYTDPTGHGYWSDVGGMYLGYYDAGASVVKGTAFMVAHPIVTAQGLGTVVAHPINTGMAIGNGVAADWNSGARGQGRVVGSALLAVGLAVAPGAEAGNLSKLGEVANAGEKVEQAAATGGRLGSQATRNQVAGVAGKLKEHGWDITGGGGERAEEYIPGPNGRKGSSYPDITATKDGKTLRVNTIDTRANGVTPTTREANNAARIRSQKPNDKLILIPKSE